MHSATIPRRRAGLREKEREEELLLFVRPDAPGAILNRSAWAVWELIDGARTLEGIVAELERDVGAAPGTLRADIERALEGMLANELISLTSPPLEPVRVFIGSDPRQAKAEIALEHSLRRNGRGPFEITWMDYGRGGAFEGWDVGRPRGLIGPERKGGWGTEFTCFRYAIPELCGFRGRALYLDSDMLVLGDLRALLEGDMSHPWMTSQLSVVQIDCAAFAGKDWWPSLAQMKRSGWPKARYLELLEQRGWIGQLPADWNCLDGRGFHPGRTRIVHFTELETQPWQPYPERIRYRAHLRAELVEAWWLEYLEGRRALASARESVRFERSAPGPDFAAWLARRRQALAAVAPAGTPPSEARVLACAPAVGELARRHRATRLLDYGAGLGGQYAPGPRRTGAVASALALVLERGGSLAEYWGVERPCCYEPVHAPFAVPPRQTFEGVLCAELLDDVPVEDLHWMVREALGLAERFAFFCVAPRAERTPDWWRGFFERKRVDFPALDLSLAFA